MNLTPEEVLASDHQSWLSHPVTKQMLKNLDSHKALFVQGVSAASTVENDIALRNNAYGLRTIDAVKVWVTDSARFVEQAAKQ